MNDKLREEVLAVLTDLCPDVDFEKEEALIDDGIVESFDVIQIVTSLMEQFDIEIDADDIEPENLNSLERIVGMVERKLN
ncbi:MAG: acyl carrier protein [Lachnospiraceae bacterium]|nr:acyl carrier protein [Lachnospiraceae bacterium]